MSFSGPDRQINLDTLKDELLNNPATKLYVGTPGGPYSVSEAEQNRDIYNALTEDGPVPLWVIKNYTDLNVFNSGTNPEFQISENVRRLAERESPYALADTTVATTENQYDTWVASARTWRQLTIEGDPNRQSGNVIDLETQEPVKILQDLTAAECLSAAQRDEIVALKDAVTEEELGRQLRVGETAPGRQSRNEIRGTPAASAQDVIDAGNLP